ncbi:hypothetical protein LPJ61_005068 [Coemansia biformis]|uniref:Uncharacterized protein n=1 Tax=Coemansia biformis TaxID=1286918 RepID=A0A9W7Y9U3_9FUNG|nr:hypothetical protein LPJ61_005068 [Coemansia biformis]
MGRRIREYPVKQEAAVRVVSHTRIVREKVLGDVDAFIRQREYGKASELLLTMATNGPIPLQLMWQLLVAVIRQQDPNQLSLRPIFDIIVADTRTALPYTTAMEQVFYTLTYSLHQAYDILLAFTNETGGKLALAQGFLGIVIACLREEEIGQLGDNSQPVQPSDGDVFKHSEFPPFKLTRHGDWQRTKHTLANAERHLAQALKLDEYSDFFVGFHAQVLLAMDRADEAVAVLERYYNRDKSIHILRMLISVDSRDPLDQHDRIAEYLELDPFAPERYLDCVVERALASPGNEGTVPMTRALRLVVDRVERGDTDETSKWRHLARLLSFFRQADPTTISAVMGPRLEWWGDVYFDWSTFDAVGTTDRIVYMAVCAQQLVDLEQGHPVYGILSGDLSDAHAEFVDQHMRLPGSAPPV